jgi:hypothetical protein
MLFDEPSARHRKRVEYPRPGPDPWGLRAIVERVHQERLKAGHSFIVERPKKR